MDAVPRALPDDATTRVDVSVIESVIDHIECGLTAVATVQLRAVVVAADDSDGVPTAIDAEVSLRSTNATFDLSPADKVSVLMELYEQCYRDGDGTAMDSPILVEHGGVRLMVYRWHAFTTWIDGLALAHFAPVILRLHPFRLRKAALAWLHLLHRNVIPTLKPLPDTHHLLLAFPKEDTDV